MTELPFETAVAERLTRAGYRLTTQREVGHYRIDLVVEAPGGKKVAVECDGDRFHPVEKLPEDLARQAVLERVRWQFIRIRGSAFFRDPDECMKQVFEMLSHYGITKEGQSTPASLLSEPRILQQEVVRRAAEIDRGWGVGRSDDAKGQGSNGPFVGCSDIPKHRMVVPWNEC